MRGCVICDVDNGRGKIQVSVWSSGVIARVCGRLGDLGGGTEGAFILLWMELDSFSPC